MAQGLKTLLLIGLGSALLSGCAGTKVSNGRPEKGFAMGGTSWQMLIIDEDAIAIGRDRPTLSFVDEGNIRGYAGCNSYFGLVWFSDQRMRFFDVGKHLTACEPKSSLELEARYHETLNSIRAYRVEGGKLALLDASQKVRFLFKRLDQPVARAASSGMTTIVAQPVLPFSYASSVPSVMPLPGSAGSMQTLPIGPPPSALASVPAMPHIASFQALSRMTPSRFAGFEFATVSPSMVPYFGTDKGAMLARLPTGDSIPLQEGDVILSVNGRAVANSSDAVRILTSYRESEKLTIEIMRRQKPLTLEVVL